MYTHTQALRGAPELARRWTSGEIFRFGPRASGLADADNRAPPYDFLKPKCIRMIVNYAYDQSDAVYSPWVSCLVFNLSALSLKFFLA